VLLTNLRGQAAAADYRAIRGPSSLTRPLRAVGMTRVAAETAGMNLATAGMDLAATARAGSDGTEIGRLQWWLTRLGVCSSVLQRLDQASTSGSERQPSLSVRKFLSKSWLISSTPSRPIRRPANHLTSLAAKLV